MLINCIKPSQIPPKLYMEHRLPQTFGIIVGLESGEFSLSQIWLVAGLYNGSVLNTVKVGWEIFSLVSPFVFIIIHRYIVRSKLKHIIQSNQLFVCFLLTSIYHKNQRLFFLMIKINLF